MPEWEYRKIDLGDLPREKTDLDFLAKAGDDGWELIAITIHNMAYLNRPISKQRSKQKKSKRELYRTLVTTAPHPFFFQ